MNRWPSRSMPKSKSAQPFAQLSPLLHSPTYILQLTMKHPEVAHAKFSPSLWETIFEFVDGFFSLLLSRFGEGCRRKELVDDGLRTRMGEDRGKGGAGGRRR